MTIVWIFKNAGDEVRICAILHKVLWGELFLYCSTLFEINSWSLTLTGVFINAVLIGSSPPYARERERQRYSTLNSTNAIPAGRWQRALKSEFKYLIVRDAKYWEVCCTHVENKWTLDHVCCLSEALIYDESETWSGCYTCSCYRLLKGSVENDM